MEMNVIGFAAAGELDYFFIFDQDLLSACSVFCVCYKKKQCLVSSCSEKTSACLGQCKAFNEKNKPARLVNMKRNPVRRTNIASDRLVDVCGVF